MGALKALCQIVQQLDTWLVTLICDNWILLQLLNGNFDETKKMPTYNQIESFLSKRVSKYKAGPISNKPTEEKSKFSKNNI